LYELLASHGIDREPRDRAARLRPMMDGQYRRSTATGLSIQRATIPGRSRRQAGRTIPGESFGAVAPGNSSRHLHAPETARRFAFIQNNMSLRNTTVCPIYKHRRTVALFRKTAGRHL